MLYFSHYLILEAFAGVSRRLLEVAKEFSATELGTLWLPAPLLPTVPAENERREEMSFRIRFQTDRLLAMKGTDFTTAL